MPPVKIDVAENGEEPHVAGLNSHSNFRESNLSKHNHDNLGYAPAVDEIDLSSSDDVKKEHAVYTPKTKPDAEEAEADKGFSIRNFFKKKEAAEKPKTISYRSLFRFADKLDVLLMVVATLCSVAHGCGMPLLLLVFGDMTQKFVQNAPNSNFTSFTPTVSKWPSEILTTPMKEEFMHQVQLSAIAFAGIGGAVLIIAYLQVAFWLIAANRQSHKIREALLRAVLRQDIGWFDTNETGGITTRLSDDISKIQEGIGDKLGAFFQWMSTCLVGLIIALVRGWKLALVCLSFSPAIAVCGAIMMHLTTASTSKELTAYAKAGAIATEALSCVKTVIVFGGQEKECERYTKHLSAAKAKGIQKNMITGAGIGMTYFVLFSSYCLAFWYGGKLIRDGEFDVGNMLVVFFCVMFSSMALGNATPSMQSLGQARGAAYYIWELIDRKPEIDSSSNNGSCPSSIVGNVDFVGIHFHYPSRSDVKILRGLTVTIKNGQTVALVGSSGCGKSTVIQLLQRFYDPMEGTVLLDGKDIKTLNIRWLRQNIGVVSQEPVLFATTIAENIRYGREGVSQEDIERAAKEANAHDFIAQLPEKYETLVGERGAQLSGGQKQRIAIARALVRNPKILLLDEATSALDTESEAIVQSALDKARQGRTTIVVAHRLSTIRSADVIYGVKDGRVHEYGTHDQLMEQEGIYYQLVTNQQTHTGNKDEDEIVVAAEEPDDEDELSEGEIRPISRGSLRHSRHSLKRQGSVTKKAVTPAVETIPDADDEKNLREVGMMELMKYNKSEWFYILMGCINSVIHGGIQPVFAIIFGGLLGVYQPGNDSNKEKQAADILLLSCMYLVIGAVSGLSFFFSLWMFGVSGETLTSRLRQRTFKAFIRQDMSFFDNPRNGTGALTTRLATDASNVQGATGVRLGMMLQAFATIGVGLIIGLIFSWKFALFILGVFPFVMLGAVMQIKLAKGFSNKNKSQLENAGKVATEAISNIRTVASLSIEEKFINDYVQLTVPGYRLNLKLAHVFGITFSLLQAMIFFCYAAIFYFGAWLIAYDYLEYDAMFKVFGAIIFGAFSLGRESQMAPDYGKAKASAARILDLLAKEPLIDSYSTTGLKPDHCNGCIELKGVEFCYPNRPTVKVMKGIDLKVEPRQTYALVGQTGCGKSTTIQLLERLYDCSAGQVTIDGIDVKELNISWLRSQLGLVSQEPVLFDCSIRENIQYGDNSRVVSMDEVIAAARQANVHQFIETLPEGYETRVGDKGTQLSGGQKQRIAIARAIVRNPKILLLDEATSALDTESEKIVQEALDVAQRGRTCLVIAHRLSTIKNASKIIVFQHGRVAEQGTHTELMNLQKGLYYKLQTTSNVK